MKDEDRAFIIGCELPVTTVRPPRKTLKKPFYNGERVCAQEGCDRIFVVLDLDSPRQFCHRHHC